MHVLINLTNVACQIVILIYTYEVDIRHMYRSEVCQISWDSFREHSEVRRK